MLGKLIKHEFRATGRVMLPVMAAMILLAGLANLSLNGLVSDVHRPDFLRVLMILIVTFFGIAVVATAVMALVLTVSRFHRNLLKDEGYLMFTLPVSVHELIWSKLIVSLVWFLVAGLLIFLVVGMTVFNLSATNLKLILEEILSPAEFFAFLDRNGLRGLFNTLVLQAVLSTLLGGLFICLHFYAALSLGHMFSKDKILLSIVFFVAISFVLSTLSSFFGINWMENNFPLMNSLSGPMDSGFEKLRTAMRFVSDAFWQGMAVMGVQSVLLYIAAWLGLRKGLNLG